MLCEFRVARERAILEVVENSSAEGIVGDALCAEVLEVMLDVLDVPKGVRSMPICVLETVEVVL